MTAPFKPSLSKMSSSSDNHQLTLNEDSEKIFGEFSWNLDQMYDTLTQRQLNEVLPQLGRVVEAITSTSDVDVLKAIASSADNDEPTDNPGNPGTSEAALRAANTALAAQVRELTSGITDFINKYGGQPVLVKDGEGDRPGQLLVGPSLESAMRAVQLQAEADLAEAREANKPENQIAKAVSDAEEALKSEITTKILVPFNALLVDQNWKAAPQPDQKSRLHMPKFGKKKPEDETVEKPNMVTDHDTFDGLRVTHDNLKKIVDPDVEPAPTS